MPYRDPDPHDPHVLVGVSVAGAPDEGRTMARALAEEFVQLGYTREELLALFSNPFYRAPHGLWRALGREAIVSIVDEVVREWEGFAARVTEA
jgi:hypothetical protein